MSLHEAALTYASKGMRVFPCVPGGKNPATPHWKEDATTNPDQINKWWNQNPNYNIGLACGKGLMVIDTEAGFDPSVLPELTLTKRSRTANKGLHHWFWVPVGIVIKNSVKLWPELDIRCDGGYVIAPPSVITGAGAYSWVGDPFDRVQECPKDLLAKILEHQKGFTKPATTNVNPINTTVTEGARNDTLFRRLCSLRSTGLANLAIVANELNQQLCNPPLDQGEVDLIVSSVEKFPVGSPMPVKTIPAGLGTISPIKPIPDSERVNDCPTAAEINPKPVNWLWHHRIALGKTNLLSGEGGIGKGALTCDWAARISTGRPFPYTGDTIMGRVAMLSAEDDPADTIVPRLIAAEADRSKIFLLRGTKRQGQPQREIDLLTDLGALEHELKKHPDIKMVIIDPITAYCGNIKDEEISVRGFLRPIEALAQRYNVAFLLIKHYKKGEAKAKERTSGTVAWVNSVRVALGVSEDEADGDLKHLYVIKGNNSRIPPAATYYTRESDYDPEIVRVEWGQETDFKAGDFSGLDAGGDKMGAAIALLKSELANGAKDQKELMTLAEAEDISEKTLRRAKDRLKLKAKKSGFTGAWRWELPEGQSSKVVNGHGHLGKHEDDQRRRSDSYTQNNDHLLIISPPVGVHGHLGTCETTGEISQDVHGHLCVRATRSRLEKIIESPVENWDNPQPQDVNNPTFEDMCKIMQAATAPDDDFDTLPDETAATMTPAQRAAAIDEIFSVPASEIEPENRPYRRKPDHLDRLFGSGVN